MAHNSIYDPIRKKFVPDLPEEKVRQKLLHFMINELHFPEGLISLEQNLKKSTFSNKSFFSSEKRRCDILVFAKDIHPEQELYPLLLIECKAHAINEDTLEQVKGYNEHIKAYFIAIANSDTIKTFWFNQEKQDYESVSFLPAYSELVQSVQKRVR